MVTDRPPIHPERCDRRTLWVWQNGRMIKKPITFVPAFYKLYDELLLEAAGNKSVKEIRVKIDVNNAIISVWNDGEPVDVNQLCKRWKRSRRWCAEFTIETADAYKRYKKVFTNHMLKGNRPSNTEWEGKSSETWTKISVKLNLAKLGMESCDGDTFALMKRRVVDLAGCLGNGVKVELDGTCFQLSFKEYVKLYPQTSTDTARIYEKVDDRWEVCIGISDGEFEQVSFVNYSATLKGGSHVDYITSKVTDYMKDFVSITPIEVKGYIRVFVNALIDNPVFDSQSRENLTTNKDCFGSTCELESRFLMEVADMLLKKRGGRLVIDKLVDSPLADTVYAESSILMLTEGDSGQVFAMSGISALGADQDKHGVYPMRGKLLNVKKASRKTLKDNVEIKKIKKILGLKDGEHYDNVKELRYGRIMILADQDHDGSHIKGLLITAFQQLWPSLLKIDKFICMISTPLIIAHHRSEDMVFFNTLGKYQEWKESVGNRLAEYNVIFNKGLGNIREEVANKVFAELDKHIKYLYWQDEDDDKAIQIAFGTDVEARRRWLRETPPQDDNIYPTLKRIRIRDFVNNEIRHHAAANIQRSIPSVVDGLKTSQRKALFIAFMNPKLENYAIKMNEFTGLVSSNVDYRHSETCLADAIIGMAQSSIGSNNINLLMPHGQYCPRLMGGKDHVEDRYLNTQLNSVARYVYPKDDELILKFLKGDTQDIEPEWYMPTVPMVLVNGSAGVGFGWSSFIPNYNPREIIANLKRLLEDKQVVKMDPFYKGFSGAIHKIKNTKYKIEAKFKIDRRKNILWIICLPVRKWPKQYMKYLDKATKEGIILGYTPRIVNGVVQFKIDMSCRQMREACDEGFLNRFKLTTTLSTANMHLLDQDGNLRRYDTPEQILVEFFSLRLDLYERRRKALLEELKKAVLLLTNKIRYIREARAGNFFFSDAMDVMYAFLKQRGFKSSTSIELAALSLGWEETEAEFVTLEDEVAAEGYDYLLTVAFAGVKPMELTKLEEELDKKKKKYDEITKKTAKALWLEDLDALDKKLMENKDFIRTP